MKLIWITLLTSLLVNCASPSPERKLASVKDQECLLKKHPTKDYYQIYHQGKPLYDHWYEEKYAMKLLGNSIKKGRCQ